MTPNGSAAALQGKTVLITGGTGSLGQVLTRRILAGEQGTPAKLLVFSRDEAKQHYMRLSYLREPSATDERIYENARRTLEFVVGDVRDYHAVASVVQRSEIVFNAAALKQVPACEYFPFEAVQTNVCGPQNIVRAIRETRAAVETVVGISTDKACKPVNVMGMTKALQERVFLTANLSCANTRFVCARYGNVLASRGSVIPLFHDQIRRGGPVTITTPEMTRFLLSLDRAVDTVFAVVLHGRRGETFVPRVPAAKVIDIAQALIGNRPVRTVVTGIRPGEKVHESLISEEESHRSAQRGEYYAIRPILAEIEEGPPEPRALLGEYCSATELLDFPATDLLLRRNGLMLEDADGPTSDRELLR